MNVDQASDMLREALGLMLMLSFPILAAALMIGLTVSIAQAVTQVQEQTLSFVPKIVGMVIVAILMMPWMMLQILNFAERMFAGY
ncbi:flagellar biosynthesis protein FliQ [Phycisphaerales bacterium AB-hyl4]|uniref:Flagellar biosynthetic protein FliQ n=1 Tax=Natronomicrosphaera hydrolytica TaxID=3242702 RepID=A0ABV4U734_9BACT